MGHLLHHVLSDSAARTPEKAALQFEGAAVSYRQLDVLSNQLANTLRAIGVRRGDRIGIYLQKSPAAIVGIFGVLKAGGIYVPLDPNSPAKRVAYIIGNCEIKVLLTSGDMTGLNDLLTGPTPVQTIVVANDSRPSKPVLGVKIVGLDDIRSENSEAMACPGVIDTDLAYILYTSGSTGEPKGVMIAHRTILSFIHWSYEKFHMTSAERVTSHAPLHFDLSTFDVFATLKAGGTVVLVPEKLSVFPPQLVALLSNERISITYLVPSILSLMVSYGNLDAYDLSALRTILFAGEVFPIKYLRKLVAAIPNAEYYNLYGPTETNVCTYYKVQPKDLSPDRTQPVPIGIACGNSEVFAVDENAQLVTAPNIQGELWVRGSCVAQGYWGAPEKTSEVFVPNVFQPHYRETAYRTGDIAMLAEDGMNWIYIGRRDHMVKSRGYRIELGDVEAALYSHENVKEAAAIAVPDDLIGNRIKAFVVSAAEELSVQDLRLHCRGLLPSYMLPETIEFCKELPRTSTGKIDRRLLLTHHICEESYGNRGDH